MSISSHKLTIKTMALLKIILFINLMYYKIKKKQENGLGDRLAGHVSICMFHNLFHASN